MTDWLMVDGTLYLNPKDTIITGLTLNKKPTGNYLLHNAVPLFAHPRYATLSFSRRAGKVRYVGKSLSSIHRHYVDDEDNEEIRMLIRDTVKMSDLSVFIGSFFADERVLRNPKYKFVRAITHLLLDETEKAEHYLYDVGRSDSAQREPLFRSDVTNLTSHVKSGKDYRGLLADWTDESRRWILQASPLLP